MHERGDEIMSMQSGENSAQGDSGAPRRLHWLLALIRRYFKPSWESVMLEDLRAYYRTADTEEIARRLIRTFAVRTAVLGAFTGILMSADEVMAIATEGEGGLGLPINILLALFVLTLDTVMMIRFQLALVACLGRLYKVPLDPDDPEDILSLFAFAAGGLAANAAGKAGLEIGGKVAARVTKTMLKKEALNALTRVSEQVGIRILQRAVVKYSLPVISIVLGAVLNFFTTRAIGRLARTHMRERGAI